MNMLTLDPEKNGAAQGRAPSARPGAPSGAHEAGRGRPSGELPRVVEFVDVADRPVDVHDLGTLTSADIDIIARGRAAGRQGLCPSLCPEVPHSREADLWLFGYEAAA